MPVKATPEYQITSGTFQHAREILIHNPKSWSNEVEARCEVLIGAFRLHTFGQNACTVTEC